MKTTNSRMELLRKIENLGMDHYKLKNIYVIFVRTVLEQSTTVQHSALTEDNKNDLERVQKSGVKLIVGYKYKGYIYSLENLE